MSSKKALQKELLIYIIQILALVIECETQITVFKIPCFIVLCKYFKTRPND